MTGHRGFRLHVGLVWRWRPVGLALMIFYGQGGNKRAMCQLIAQMQESKSVEKFMIHRPLFLVAISIVTASGFASEQEGPQRARDARWIAKQLLQQNSASQK